MAEIARQTYICKRRRAGNSRSDIIKTNGYAKMTVYRAVAKFDAKDEAERSHDSPLKDRKRTKTFMVGLKRSTKADPSQSMMKLAKKRINSH